MLRQSRRVVVGAVLALVVFAGPAAAECAWVLWSIISTTGRTGSTTQNPSDSYEKLEDCKRQADILSQRAQKQPLEYAATAWFCLPDTVDPRGPKGSTR